jgi:aryl-alcohol dehydrogenase-like predicted oxidoreductase
MTLRTTRLHEQPTTRRKFLRGCAAALAAGTIAPALGRAEAAACTALPTRAIPATGERIPMVGLGTNAYGVTDPTEIDKRRAVIARLVELGARVVDTARAYGDSELVVGRILKDSGLRDRVFLTTKTPMTGDLSNPKSAVDEAFTRLGTTTIDLLQIHNMYGVPELMPTLRELQEAKRVRYLGATTSQDAQYPALLDAMRTQPLQFIQVDYSIDNRNAAAEVLPLARDRGLAVLVNMPYGGRRDGNLLRKLGQTPLPGWAKEIDAASWAEVLLKYVLSHPAVTCAIPGTTSVANVETNVRASLGALPDDPLRRRMEHDWDALRL